MEEDDNHTVCPQCQMSCLVSLQFHQEEYHLHDQVITFPDGHAQTLSRDLLDKVFQCPRCSHPESRMRAIRNHCAQCHAPANAQILPPPPPLPPPPAEDVEMDRPDTPAGPEPLYAPDTILHPRSETITHIPPSSSPITACNSLSPRSAHHHICSEHQTLMKPPPDMVTALTEEYGLRNPSDRLSLPPYQQTTTGFRPPSLLHTLHRMRQVGLDPPRENTTGYAQQFCTGTHNSWFLVDMAQRMRPPNIDFQSLASRLDLGIPDYNTQHVLGSSPTLPGCNLRSASTPPMDNNVNSQILVYIDIGSGYKPHYPYPITTDQHNALNALLVGFHHLLNDDAPTEDYTESQHELDENKDIDFLDPEDPPPKNGPEPTCEDLLTSALDQAIQRVVLALFRHEQTGQTKDNLFLVLSSIKPDGSLILANSITQRITHFTYCGCGSFMLEIECTLMEHPDWNFHQAHALIKKYHTNGYVMPLVAIFQLFASLGHQAVDWKGVIVPRDKLRLPYDALITDIETILTRDVFFGKPIPLRLWILSHADLREKFTYCAEGAIQWRPTPVRHLMDSLDSLGLKTALAHEIGVPSLSRANEIADMSLRNTIGSTTRNFQVILNTVTLVSTLNKTSCKHLSYKNIPSASPTLLARYIL
ncbi:hypothetical protein B0H13DRAFT_2321307 [Mycena leptocephala]|nr:hypothetical protein B0H13DRAFT_2321307 [Mycena leptocephala]